MCSPPRESSDSRSGQTTSGPSPELLAPSPPPRSRSSEEPRHHATLECGTQSAQLSMGVRDFKQHLQSSLNQERQR